MNSGPWQERRGTISLVVVGILIATLGWGTGCIREEPPPVVNEEGTDPVAIYDLQTPHPDNEFPALGSQVYIRSVVVTAYDTYAEPRQDRVQRGDEYVCVEDVGYTGGVVVQEFEGGSYSGISAFAPSLVPAHQSIGAGDIVDIWGEYLEFCLDDNNAADSYCQAPNSDRLTQIGGATVTKVGEASSPEPVSIRLEDLDPSRAEPYEGVLVQIDQRLPITRCESTDDRGRPNCCVGDYDRYGNLAVGDISVTNEFYSIPEGTRCVSSISGIVAWFFDYALSPRGPDDVVIPPECQAQGG